MNIHEVPHLDSIRKQTECFISKIGLGQENLYPTAPILDVGEGDLAHRPKRTDPPDDRDFRAGRGQCLECIKRFHGGMSPFRFLRIDRFEGFLQLRQLLHFHGNDIFTHSIFLIPNGYYASTLAVFRSEDKR